MSEMSERVVRAILSAGNEASSGLDDEGITEQMARAAASAAIEIMGQPSPHAIARAADRLGMHPSEAARLFGTWQIMVEEALR